jgi:hypothetical protein
VSLDGFSMEELSLLGLTTQSVMEELIFFVFFHRRGGGGGRGAESLVSGRMVEAHFPFCCNSSWPIEVFRPMQGCLEADTL